MKQDGSSDYAGKYRYNTAEKYGYNIKYTFNTNPVWIRHKKERLSKGVDLKDIGRFDKETSEAIKEWRLDWMNKVRLILPLQWDCLTPWRTITANN